jgi:hypothetical protein
LDWNDRTSGGSNAGTASTAIAAAYSSCVLSRHVPALLGRPWPLRWPVAPAAARPSAVLKEAFMPAAARLSAGTRTASRAMFCSRPRTESVCTGPTCENQTEGVLNAQGVLPVHSFRPGLHPVHRFGRKGYSEYSPCGAELSGSSDPAVYVAWCTPRSERSCAGLPVRRASQQMRRRRSAPHRSLRHSPVSRGPQSGRSVPT